MTTPVHMEKRSGENTMAFVLPKKFTDENTPQPNDASLNVYEDKGGYYAAIKYSGYTNASKEKENTRILLELLGKKKILPTGSPKVLVYNSPYQFINRRNEIVIPVQFKSQKND